MQELDEDTLQAIKNQLESERLADHPLKKQGIEKIALALKSAGFSPSDELGFFICDETFTLFDKLGAGTEKFLESVLCTEEIITHSFVQDIICAFDILADYDVELLTIEMFQDPLADTFNKTGEFDDEGTFRYGINHLHPYQDEICDYAYYAQLIVLSSEILTKMNLDRRIFIKNKYAFTMARAICNLHEAKLLNPESLSRLEKNAQYIAKAFKALHIDSAIECRLAILHLNDPQRDGKELAKSLNVLCFGLIKDWADYHMIEMIRYMLKTWQKSPTVLACFAQKFSSLLSYDEPFSYYKLRKFLDDVTSLPRFESDAVAVLNCMLQLTKAGICTEANYRFIFENVSYSAAIGSAAEAMQEAGLLTQDVFDSICRKPGDALLYAEKNGGKYTDKNIAAREYIRIRSVSRFLFLASRRETDRGVFGSVPLQKDMLINIASYCGVDNVLDAGSYEYIARKTFEECNPQQQTLQNGKKFRAG